MPIEFENLKDLTPTQLSSLISLILLPQLQPLWPSSDPWLGKVSIHLRALAHAIPPLTAALPHLYLAN